jgi:3-deoxy-D-manno-octulosonate 8-phosphate phosphatase (KDO 8-P phosphatase)
MQPVQFFSPELLSQAQNIKIAFFDVDGVLTDGSLYYSSTGEIVKQFNSLDGHGLKLLQQGGIIPAVITGRDSPALRKRLFDLGIHHAKFSTENKVNAAKSILSALTLTFSDAACMGDDWPDLTLMRSCHVCCAPNNAHIEVRHAAHFVTPQSGGAGAARQWCDALLAAAGRYGQLLGSS